MTVDEDLLLAACLGYAWEYPRMDDAERKRLRRKMLNALQRYEAAKADPAKGKAEVERAFKNEELRQRYWA